MKLQCSKLINPFYPFLQLSIYSIGYKLQHRIDTYINYSIIPGYHQFILINSVQLFLEFVDSHFQVVIKWNWNWEPTNSQNNCPESIIKKTDSSLSDKIFHVCFTNLHIKLSKEFHLFVFIVHLFVATPKFSIVAPEG